MTDDKKDAKESREAVAGVFGSREEARHALGELHKAHFRHVWLGVTSVATTSQGDAAMTVESAGSFFSQSLRRSLMPLSSMASMAMSHVESPPESGPAMRS